MHEEGDGDNALNNPFVFVIKFENSLTEISGLKEKCKLMSLYCYLWHLLTHTDLENSLNGIKLCHMMLSVGLPCMLTFS